MKLVNINFFEGGKAHESFVRNAIKLRTEILKHVSKEEAKLAAEAVGGAILDPPPIDDSAVEWAVFFEPIRNLKICYLMRRNEPEFPDELQVLYEVEGLPFKIPGEDISVFTVLYANALIYAVKNVVGRRDIPGIGSYL